MGVSAVFVHCCVIGDPALSFLFPRTYFVLQNKQWKALLRLFLPRRALVNSLRMTCGIPFLELLFLEQTGGVIVLYVEEMELAQIALSLVLLCYKEGGRWSRRC